MLTSCFVGLSRGAMSMSSRDRLRESAEAKFKKAEVQLQDRQKATTEYEASRRAVDANMARLRELRLARDAAGGAAPAAKLTKVLAAKKRKPRKAVVRPRDDD